MTALVTVAIPVRDGAATLPGVLSALAAQDPGAGVEVELLVCDSGSSDGSAALAGAAGARVIEIPPASFGHGRTRNLLMAEARGEHVALLTQDAEPASDGWLAALLRGFALAPDVALVYGPYRPRPAASPLVRAELTRWFASLAPDGAPRIDRLSDEERARPPAELFGRRTFFTDANACVSRAAWERVPFREVAYAEDHALALDMLRAGHAKVYVPDAAVLHSHDYTASEYVRRCFDEWRALHEVYGWREPASPRALVRNLRGELGAARRELGAGPATLATVAARHGLRTAGALLGSRADRLPARARRALSLERRA
ncbi:MAG TPA: glycosyltransferase family 2 protein [Solirubrobacteraceae bacterium]|nr:glycosyltransferase family 2 protein [Solirubrobacteraceae bacterium]